MFTFSLSLVKKIKMLAVVGVVGGMMALGAGAASARPMDAGRPVLNGTHGLVGSVRAGVLSHRGGHLGKHLSKHLGKRHHGLQGHKGGQLHRHGPVLGQGLPGHHLHRR